MIRVSQITIDTSTLPPAFQAVLTSIDAVLSPTWGLAEFERTFTVTWSSFGGLTQTRWDQLQAIMAVYKEAGRGWNVRIGPVNNATTTEVIFSRLL